MGKRKVFSLKNQVKIYKGLRGILTEAIGKSEYSWQSAKREAVSVYTHLPPLDRCFNWFRDLNLPMAYYSAEIALIVLHIIGDDGCEDRSYCGVSEYLKARYREDIDTIDSQYWWILAEILMHEGKIQY